jgi:plasmid replication initiation protein
MDQLTIVQANDLVDASYSLSINEVRLISLAATMFDSRKPNCGEIKIYIADFKKAYGIDYCDIYSQLREAVKSIMRKPIKLYDSEINEVNELAWLVGNRYNPSGDGSYVSMTFSPLIEPYLFELKERFTKIDFKYAAKLNTPFSFRLYQWLKKVEHLNKNKNGGAVSIELDIQWMKDQAQIIGKYADWRDFKKYVIVPAVDKINNETDLSVMWEPIKTGRAISGVQFTYVIETGAFAKPVRPRLKRRPKVIKGSDAEGSWMRANLKLLLAYEVELKAYDSAAKLDIKDIERIAEYSSICDRETHKRAFRELADRRSNRTPNE